MPLNVFGGSSDNSIEIDTSAFVKKTDLRVNYIESDMEEDINMKNQFRIKNLPNPINLQDPATKYYVDNKTNNIVNDIDNNTIVRNNKNTNFNNNTFTGLESIYVNRDPNFPLEVSTKQYTDDSIDETTILRNNKDNNLNNNELTNIKAISLNVDPINKFDDYEIDNLVPKSIIDEFVSTNIDEQSLLRLHKDEKLQLDGKDFITLESNLTNPKKILYIPLNTNLVRRDRDNDFNNFSLNNISSITLNSQAVNDNEVITKAYVDQFHQENERTRRDVGLDFYNETNDLVKNNQNNDFNNNEIINVKSIEINEDPINDNHVVNKKYVYRFKI